MAQTNEALADFVNAAKLYRAFGLGFPKEDKAKLALYNAATLYKGLKEYQESIGLYKKFIQMYSRDELSRNAHMEIAEMSETTKNFPEAIQHYTIFVNQYTDRLEPNLVARARISKIHMLSGNQKEGLKEIRRLTKDLTGKNAPAALEARRIAAEALLQDLNSETRGFMELRITDASKIEAEVQGKQERLLGLVKRYQEIIELSSGEHTVASLYRMGEMHENFAKILFDAPAPAGSDQGKVNQYRSSIEKVAFPLRDEAGKFFEAAYKRSQEVQTFTEWTRRSYEKMVELQPDKFPAVIEKTTSPTYMSHAMIWDESVSSIAD
jgi:tetratricopeptide (TPR) repeat protein